MNLRKLVALAFAALAASCTTNDTNAPPRELTVETALGLVEGFENDGVFSYRGIPYAAPPVGELRWKPPVEPDPWTDTLLALDAPPPCPQTTFRGLPVPGFNPNEDCLYLNIDTPPEGSGLPVMVWIHGGGFTIGEGLQTDGGTTGDRIARQEGVVVVSMNYRLGQLGFLAHSALTEESPDGASGNYGLMDQTAALRWVQRNIRAFGGDPNNVTIFGDSAGAYSVCSHLASAVSAGSFAKAIMMSGSCERPWSTRSAAEAQGDDFAEELGCGGETDVLGCMRSKSFGEVLAALPPGDNFGFNPTVEPPGRWGPIVDGHFLIEQPADSFSSGRFNRVPTIIGFTREEARLFTWFGEFSDPPLVVTEENYETLLAYYFGGDTELAAEAAARYPLDDYSEPTVALADVVTDTIFRCPGRTEARKLVAHVPTYLYQFEYPDGRSQLEAASSLLMIDPPSYDLAAFHGADIPYVFGFSPLLELSEEGLVLSPWSPGTPDESLWLDVLGYFVRFATNGAPNEDGGVRWPPYEAETDSYLAVDTPVRAASRPTDRCDFWDGVDYLKPDLPAN